MYSCERAGQATSLYAVNAPVLARLSRCSATVPRSKLRWPCDPARPPTAACSCQSPSRLGLLGTIPARPARGLSGGGSTVSSERKLAGRNGAGDHSHAGARELDAGARRSRRAWRAGRGHIACSRGGARAIASGGQIATDARNGASLARAQALTLLYGWHGAAGGSGATVRWGARVGEGSWAQPRGASVERS